MDKDILQMRNNHEISFQEIENRIHNMCHDPDNTIEFLNYGYTEPCYVSQETIERLKAKGRRVDVTFIYGSIFGYYTIFFR